MKVCYNGGREGGIMAAPPHHHCEPCVFEDAVNMAATVAKRMKEKEKNGGKGAWIAYREMDVG